MADEGFDVWLGNARGNIYSRNHTILNPDGDKHERSKFWNFSWHEIGIYDLPATIDHILHTTQMEKLHYIGHSQGCTTLFVMCSERPEYNKKILFGNMLAPAAYMSPMKNFLFNLFSDIDKVFPLVPLADSIGLYEFLPSEELYGLFGRDFCYNKTNSICERTISFFLGKGTDQWNLTMVPVISGHTPSGSSTNQVIHYVQLVEVPRFQQFDYGKIGNLFRYKCVTPPEYDLSKVKAKLAFYFTRDNDGLILGENVRRLIQMLPNVMSSRVVQLEDFNHSDFLWGINAKSLIYKHIIDDMKQADLIE